MMEGGRKEGRKEGRRERRREGRKERGRKESRVKRVGIDNCIRTEPCSKRAVGIIKA